MNSENNLNNNENGREPDSGINGLNGSGFIYSSGPDSTPEENQSGQDSANQPQTNETGSQNPNPSGFQSAQNPTSGYQSPNYRDSAPFSNGQYQHPNGQPGSGYYGRPPKKSKGSKVYAFIIVVIVLAIVAYGFYPIISSIGADTTTTAAAENETKIEGADKAPTLNLNDSEQPTNGQNTGDSLDASSVYKKIRESAVGILVYAGDGNIYTEGSGVIMGEDEEHKYTYIITCAHVINSRNTSISVQLYDGTDYVAEVVGYDKRTDIGVVRIKAKGLKAAEFGSSDNLEVGQKVYAIGNPGGTEFAGSFTDGIISAIDRPINSSSTGYTMICIQHTAAINPGNSGGALVNSRGQVIGINSMKIVSTDYEGMGFAVPSKIFQEIFNQLVKNGYVPNRPKLGIKYLPASAYQNLSIVVQLKDLPAGTIVIEEISPDSDLYNSKVQVKDLIIAVNGKDLTNTDVLPNLIEQSKVGDKLTLTIVRVNKNYSLDRFDVTVTLKEDKGDTSVTEEPTTSFYFPFG